LQAVIPRKRHTCNIVKENGEFVIGLSTLETPGVADTRSEPDKVKDMGIILIESRSVKAKSIKVLSAG